MLSNRVLLAKRSTKQTQLDEDQILIELSKAPQFSDLLFNQFLSKIHWITVTCSLVTILYWWTKEQLHWSLCLILSFTCNLILHLFVSCFYTLDQKQQQQQEHQFVTELNKREDVNLSDELLKESRTIKHKEWLNRFLNELWPRACLNCKMDFQEKGKQIGSCFFLNKLNLSKTQTPKIEKIALANRLDTSNGQIIILELLATIDWSTINNENLISLSIYNLQFTISNLYSIACKFKVRICLHYLNKQLNNSLYKINLTLIDLPVIKQYEVSGAAYLLYFFNLHLTFVYWLINNFILFPRTLMFVLNKNVFDLDHLTDKLKTNSFIDQIDLDDFKNLSLQCNNIDFLDELIFQGNAEQIKDILISNKLIRLEKDSKEAFNDEVKAAFEQKRLLLKKPSEQQTSSEEINKIKLFQDAFSVSLKNKIANYILHLTVMYGLNVPIPKQLNCDSIANLSYFVRIRYGDFKFITNSHVYHEPVLYWMQSFVLASSKLNSPVYLAILVNQINDETANQPIKPDLIPNLAKANPTSVTSFNKEQIIKKAVADEELAANRKLKECFEIKLTDNLEQFLNSHNLNGRLYTFEDEISKCRLTIRFSVFNLKMPNYKIQNLFVDRCLFNEESSLTSSALPLGVLNLFISHITNIDFISNFDRQSLDQFGWLSVRTFSQHHLFRSLNIGNEQAFKQNCFLIIFNPVIESIQFKLYFASKSSSDPQKPTKSKTINLDSTIKTNPQFLITPLTALNPQADQQQQKLDEPFDAIRLKNDLKTLAKCNIFINLKKLKPQYEIIKLYGSLKDSYLHLFYCYSEIVNSKRILRIMLDSEEAGQNYTLNLQPSQF